MSEEVSVIIEPPTPDVFVVVEPDPPDIIVTVSEVALAGRDGIDGIDGIDGVDGIDGIDGISGVGGDISAHVNSLTPHPVYDDGPSLLLLYQNAKV